METYFKNSVSQITISRRKLPKTPDVITVTARPLIADIIIELIKGVVNPLICVKQDQIITMQAAFKDLTQTYKDQKDKGLTSINLVCINKDEFVFRFHATKPSVDKTQPPKRELLTSVVCKSTDSVYSVLGVIFNGVMTDVYRKLNKYPFVSDTEVGIRSLNFNPFYEVAVMAIYFARRSNIHPLAFRFADDDRFTIKMYQAEVRTVALHAKKRDPATASILDAVDAHFSGDKDTIATLSKKQDFIDNFTQTGGGPSAGSEVNKRSVFTFTTTGGASQRVSFMFIGGVNIGQSRGDEDQKLTWEKFI